MTKKEIRNTINKSVYEYAETLGYTMSDDGDGARVTFTPENCKSYDDTIEYSRSQHDTCVMNEASDKVKADADKIDRYARAVEADIKWKLALENGDIE